MTDLLKIGKKVFTVSVVVMTILWSVGVSALVPLVAVAADCPELEAGDLFKVPGDSAVFYVNADMEKMYFFNSEVYHTWYDDFSGVVEIAPTCTDAYPDAKGVSYLPGSVLVKTTISPSVYVVEPNNKLEKLADENAAKALYGTDWAKKVRDVPSIFFLTFTKETTSLDGTKPHEGMLVKKGTVTYKVDGGALKTIDGTLPAFVAKYVQSPAASVVDALAVANTVAITATSITKDVAQKASAVNIPVTVKSSTSDTSESKSKSTIVNSIDGANYAGPFPAPEGMILTGTFGEDKFQDPTGNGTYRFKIQTAWKKDIACKDTSRTVVGSKGKTWEEGYWKGGDLGTTAKGAVIVIYDETPKGTKAGTALYDEGYKAGYAIGFAGKAPPYVYGCHVDDGFDISKYDKDGWVKQSVDKLPGLNTLYMPAKGAALSKLDSVLGSNGVVFSFDAINDPINKSVLNIGKPDLNISRMDIIEGQLDSAEAALSTEAFAQAYYSQQKKVIENKYKGTCTVADAAVTSELYGSNNFTNLAFITVCLDSSGGENKWTLSKYSFRKIPGDKMLMISLPAASDVKTKGADTTNSAKIPSKDFITQLYSKIQIK